MMLKIAGSYGYCQPFQYLFYKHCSLLGLYVYFFLFFLGACFLFHVQARFHWLIIYLMFSMIICAGS